MKKIMSDTVSHTASSSRFPPHDWVETTLDVSLIDKQESKPIFMHQADHTMHRYFVEHTDAKKHNLKEHTAWFNTTIKLNHNSENNLIINKRKIVLVDFGMNVGTEINGIRPAIIYKSSTYKYGEDVVVLPITSFDSQKSQDALDVVVDSATSLGLDHPSLIKIRQIKSISKKRIRKDKKSGKIKILGEIKDETIQTQIDTTVKKLLGL